MAAPLTPIQVDCLERHGMCLKCLKDGVGCSQCKPVMKRAKNPCEGCVHWRPRDILPRGCQVRFSEGVAEITGNTPRKKPAPKVEELPVRSGLRLYGHICKFETCRKFFESEASRASFCPDCRPKAYERPRAKACRKCQRVFVAKKKVKECPDCRGVNQPKPKERLCRECKTAPVTGNRAKLCAECRRMSWRVWRSR